VQMFRKITCRCSLRRFLFLGVMTTIGYFQFFAEPYVMTATAGP
jgi:ABC-type sugar transport system permease subunit